MAIFVSWVLISSILIGAAGVGTQQTGLRRVDRTLELNDDEIDWTLYYMDELNASADENEFFRNEDDEAKESRLLKSNDRAKNKRSGKKKDSRNKVWMYEVFSLFTQLKLLLTNIFISSCIYCIS